MAALVLALVILPASQPSNLDDAALAREGLVAVPGIFRALEGDEIAVFGIDFRGHVVEASIAV